MFIFIGTFFVRKNEHLGLWYWDSGEELNDFVWEPT